MFSKNSSKTIDGSFLLQSHQMERLEEELGHILVPESSIGQIEGELSEMEGEVPSEDLASFYGSILDAKVNNEIDALFEEAQDVALVKESKSPAYISQRVTGIRERMSKLREHHGLDLENRRFARAISLNLKKAERFLSSKSANVIHQNAIELTQKQREMTPLDVEVISTESSCGKWESGELAIELCELAHIFYQERIGEGLRQLNALPNYVRERIFYHCCRVEAEVPYLEMPCNRSDYRENITRFTQALIGYASEVAQGEDLGLYPTMDELSQMFEEAESLG